jgi:hypothetical protein
MSEQHFYACDVCGCTAASNSVLVGLQKWMVVSIDRVVIGYTPDCPAKHACCDKCAAALLRQVAHTLDPELTGNHHCKSFDCRSPPVCSCDCNACIACKFDDSRLRRGNDQVR